MHFSRFLFVPVLVLFIIGLVMIFNTSSADVLDHLLNKSTHGALFKQIIYGLAGGICGYMAFTIGYRRLIDNSPLILFFVGLFLLFVLIPGIGVKANGARRWLSIFGMSLQPSEFAKFILPLYFVFRIQKLDQELDLSSFLKIIAPPGVIILLILLEPNNGTALVVMSVLVLLFFLSKVPLRFWAAPLFSLTLVISVFALNMPYVRSRLEIYFHPELDLKGKGHQPYQAKIAAGSGGVLGKGPGRSLQKLSYLPEAQNDYIAAIFAEEYGFIGMLFMLCAYSAILLLGLTVAYQAESREGLYIAAACTFLFTFQAFLNLGVVSGLLPSTGLNLPFFSQGGSSLIANCIGLGVLMSIPSGARRESFGKA